MSRIRTIIGIPAPGSYWGTHYRLDAVDDVADDEPEDEIEQEPNVDYYEEAYYILTNGITEALDFLSVGNKDAAIKCLKDRQHEADELVTK